MGAALELRLLGPLRVRRGSEAVALPASRKLRALLGYLALARAPAPRSQLCELLWDAPGDPRGELRWCLSKLRGVLDAPERVLTHEDSVRLQVDGALVDALEVARAAEEGIESLPLERLRDLAGLFAGELLEGLEPERAPAFEGWLLSQRRRFRGCQAAILEQLARRAPEDEALAWLEKWRELAPFDPRVHEALLGALARRGRIAEGEAHLAATVRLFEAEGLDPAPLGEAWRAARGTALSFSSEISRALPEEKAFTEDKNPRRRSIAVMPFADRARVAGAPGGAADALARDVIARLARLRSLFVIGSGTVFALHERGLGAEDAGRILNVDYIVSGSVRAEPGRIAVEVELSETRSARVVWAEAYRQKADDAFLVLEEIGNRIVASVAAEVELQERNRALLKPPSSLDAWEAYHRGLWHMYRYKKADNDTARGFFNLALRLDPTFSRAWAGLAFTHFQGAFQAWEPREPQMEKAYEAGAQALLADERDPAAHWAMGRALLLHRRWDESEAALQRSVELSPNFALGHYNLSFLRSMVGDPEKSIADAQRSRRLSPYDPMLFGMLAAPAMALVRLRRFEEAADWATRAAARPNAFPHIHAIAALSLALAGREAEARAQAALARRADPRYGIEDFLLTFPFEPEGEALFRKGAQRLGMG